MTADDTIQPEEFRRMQTADTGTYSAELEALAAQEEAAGEQLEAAQQAWIERRDQLQEQVRALGRAYKDATKTLYTAAKQAEAAYLEAVAAQPFQVQREATEASFEALPPITGFLQFVRSSLTKPD